MDWEQNEPAQVTSDALNFGLKGFMFDKRRG